MSTITSLSDHKNPTHRRNDSDELDVFEAARYFSHHNDNNALIEANEKIVIKEARQGYLRQGRASLDMPSLKHQQQHYYKQCHQNYTIAQIEQHPQTHQVNQHHHQDQQQPQVNKEKKKHKQPSSPGGKLAHFLNSLFNQKTINSKNKKQPKSTQSMKVEYENPNGRRQRRSSISHFPTTTTTSSSLVDAKSFYSSSSSGFRTPPPYTINNTTTTTTTKTCQNIKSFDDYKQVLDSLAKYKVHANNVKDDHKVISATTNNINGIIVEKTKNYDHGIKKQDKFDEVDEGAESDDLFELQIDYDFGFCSSGLPVYETTHLDSIKRPSSTPITNGPIKK